MIAINLVAALAGIRISLADNECDASSLGVCMKFKGGVSSACCVEEKKIIADPLNANLVPAFCEACKDSANEGIKDQMQRYCKKEKFRISPTHTLGSSVNNCMNPASPTCTVQIPGVDEVYTQVNSTCCDAWKEMSGKPTDEVAMKNMCAACDGTANPTIGTYVILLKGGGPCDGR